ncbi:MAG: tRNA lysidine(34) synthetase TilS, partial [Bacteroidota bacterium]
MYGSPYAQDLVTAFVSFIQQEHLIEKGEATLLGVSGGVDSVVMSALFHKAQLPFAMAHCHFGLRGSEADQDAAWVRQLAATYEVPLYVQSFDTAAFAHKHKLSIQMAARQLRYRWFEEVCARDGLAKIATAHHSDDSLETVLINLSRGTGIAGLQGIAPRRGKVIRPLLFTDKATLRQYAQSTHLAWRQDASNAQEDYTRNFIRHRVIPQLMHINPRLATTNQLTLERLRHVNDLFQEQVAAIGKQIVHKQGAQYHVHVAALQDKSWAPTVLATLLAPFGFQFASLRHFMLTRPQPGKLIESGTHRLYVDRHKWIIVPHTQVNPTVYTIFTAEDSELTLAQHRLQMRVMPRAQYTIIPDAQVAALDLARLTFPLTIRKWQPGDTFYPLGMQQRKKLSDFLVDSKVPRPHKADTYVMLTGSKLVWVLGHRIDDRFKITQATQQVYEMQLMGQENTQADET